MGTQLERGMPGGAYLYVANVLVLRTQSFKFSPSWFILCNCVQVILEPFNRETISPLKNFATLDGNH